MPSLDTRALGPIDYDDGAVVHFPAGLPAFEQFHAFLLIERPEFAPFLFLQSADDKNLSFPLLPAQAIEGSCGQPEIDDDDQARLGASEAPPDCYFIITLQPGGKPSANLLAPILVNWQAKRGIQAVQTSPTLSHQHPLEPSPRTNGEGKPSSC